MNCHEQLVKKFNKYGSIFGIHQYIQFQYVWMEVIIFMFISFPVIHKIVTFKKILFELNGGHLRI